MTHHVKITPKHFEEILSGRKNFEIRFNDRGYKVGDIVELQEYQGYSDLQTCPDICSCAALLEIFGYDDFESHPCPIGRESCGAYRKHLYSGRSIYVNVLDVFDIGDVFQGYVAFSFTIRSKRNCD